MKQKVLKIHPSDNVLVALTDLKKDEEVHYDGSIFLLKENVEAKHKFFETDMPNGSQIFMYGVIVGTTQQDVQAGAWMNVNNVKHATSDYHWRDFQYTWAAPDVTEFEGRTFMGYHRKDGNVGTANYWLFIPMVFCENRNMDVIREALHN